MRCSGVGTRRPPLKRGRASERLAFHLQRLANIGAARVACSRASCKLEARTSPKASDTGKLCCSPSESTNPSSVAAACSSKSNVTQKRLRMARPQARLMRPPNGACTTNCMPPASSKKRSAITVCWEGTSPKAATVSET